MRLKILIFSAIIIFANLFVVADCATWSHPEKIKVYIPPNDPKTITAKRAFAEWSRKTQDRFVFYYIQNKKLADIEIIFLEKQTKCGDRALACTLYSGHSKHIEHAVIYMAKYTNDKTNRKIGKNEYYTAFLHEIGHAIGLDHNNNKASIMYPMEDDKQEILNSDIKTLYKLYGMKTH